MSTFTLSEIYLMNLFKLFGFKRKLDIFSSVEDFFELHASPTEEKKDKNSAKNKFFSKKKFKRVYVKILAIYPNSE